MEEPVYQPSLKNERGFTLVEVMVAILILTIGMLGLLETMNVSIQHNLKNQYREEAIRIGARYMTELRGKSFTATFNAYSSISKSQSYATQHVPSTLRGSNKVFTVERYTSDLASDADGPTSEQLNVTVKWAFRNQSSVNRISTVVTRQ
jgi:type IV pilus assembly protein PilV